MSDELTAGSAVTSGYSACLPARVLLLSHALLLQAIGYKSHKTPQLRCFGWTITLGVSGWYGTHARVRALGDESLSHSRGGQEKWRVHYAGSDPKKWHKVLC
jgi:hypothetical protein